MTEHSFNNFSSDGQNAATSGTLRHGSLFSGIGGFDLAAELMGWENVFHCEWNDFGKRILNYYWPNAISYDDITKTDFTIHRGKIDILTGGFPCQPYSSAGKRLGKEDDRHLWPEMLRAIREIKPRYIVGENVSGLLSWNGGLVFNEVQAELEAEGYEVQPCVLPACAVNAPHRRDRVWFIAINSECESNGEYYRGTSEGKKGGTEGTCLVQEGRNESSNHTITSDNSGINTNTTSDRRTREGQGIKEKTRAEGLPKTRKFEGRLKGLCNERNATNTECKRQQEQRKPERSVYKETSGEWKASWAYDDGR